MDGNDDPIEDSKIGDESGQESQGEGMEVCFPMDCVKEGVNANQAKNSRSKFGKERIRRIPDKRLRRISLFFMDVVLRNKKTFFKEDLIC
jgi:hypothetical protein